MSTQATPYMIDSNLDIDTVYGTDSYSVSASYSGIFDLASILGTSNFFTDYLVNSASVFFQWTDDLDDLTTKTSE
ncbi:hypothetical protein RZS08_26430, partial [Arthrospira platensis SPKY1]|nr:hypothetical protein [Arthrospira platensis SPKY1]